MVFLSIDGMIHFIFIRFSPKSTAVLGTKHGWKIEQFRKWHEKEMINSKIEKLHKGVEDQYDADKKNWGL
jgi:hypothetical protein